MLGPATNPSRCSICQMLLLALVLLIPGTVGMPAPLHLPHWLSPLIPEPVDGSFNASVKCYSLPYGGIGFLGHILTYWTVVMLIYGRSPWLLKELTHWKVDFLLGIGSLGATSVLSILAIVRCHSEWPFILIATWKMLLSISLSLIAMHRAIAVLRGSDTQSPAYWLILYGAGIVIGLTGLIALTVKNWPERTLAMEIICGVFGGIVLFCFLFAFIVLLIVLYEGDSLKKFISIQMSWIGALGISMAVIGVLTALWSDWILAAMEVKDGGSWAGLPSSDIAWLYWSYFAAKRLTLFLS